ncbi:MAG: 30S ribosomal protein S16 [Bacteroidales bacterium]|nr:30S ribosomal protein S16 [Bacteroidales bacterium]
MPTKIRLARHGKKKSPFYYIVVADSRAPRDGKFIEKIGTYNPITNPATIDLDFEKALDWLQKGAVPTETCRAILSYKGVIYMKHLLGGVKKGAFDEATAKAKFEAWKQAKERKIEEKKNHLSRSASDEMKKRLEAEAQVNEKRQKAIAEKKAKELEKAKEAEASENQTETTNEVENNENA